MGRILDNVLDEEEEIRRAEAHWEYEEQLTTARNDIIPFLQGAWVNLHQEWGDDAIHTKALQQAIWKASTEMLPNLEVQVVIDGNNRAHISSGSSGYVSFLKNPIGMKLPIKCWFHTHPFGAAYFSGVDWGTVIPWTPRMETAYVIGGEDHYGFWINTKPTELEIKLKDGTYKIQHRDGKVELLDEI
tara:strand:+ start:214 stop:774 length:561 start_codon:yes stop_codon:yes gene_type:complete